ncbi:hypothetical protein TNCV_3901651 [Trichonephila clavipes]|nr:hypothetical protein TNCV_3901651 [Trichonephila clavipes]
MPERQRQVIVTEIVQSFSRIGQCSAIIDGQMIVRRIETNTVCLQCQVTWRKSMMWHPPLQPPAIFDGFKGRNTTN